MRGLVAMAIAATLAGILALSASGAEPRPRPLATATLLEGTLGTDGSVEARGTVERRYAGAAANGAGSVEDGVLMARGSAQRGTAVATATTGAVSLLDGRVVAAGLRRTARATVGGAAAATEGVVRGLQVDGRPIGDVTEPQTIPLADGTGRVEVNTGASAVRLVLTAATGGLPEGTDVHVGAVRAQVKPPRPAPSPTPTPDGTATPTPEPQEPDRPAGPKPDPTATATPKQRPGLVRKAAPKVPSRLTSDGFAFPVHGKVTFADTFGAPRQAAVGGSHLGTDVFADFGAPVLAVADGTVSRVGTLDISGNRLWLTTDDGDAFFYAHLSAFSPTAVNGRQVKAGTVLGFVGNTGDAEPTPPHLHFEIHPGGMKEPAIDPYPVLLAWQGRRDVPQSAWLQAHGPDTTERPGALVAVRDFIAE